MYAIIYRFAYTPLCSHQFNKAKYVPAHLNKMRIYAHLTTVHTCMIMRARTYKGTQRAYTQNTHTHTHACIHILARKHTCSHTHTHTRTRTHFET